ncbi:MAG: PEP-utilizing enzyme, partial [Actinomycetota bacterium]|nr:PEP-utilizing enzyme [Actinomycetota bacterium]
MTRVRTGTPVVPGVGFGPAVRPAPRPVLPTGSEELPESQRPAELARFSAAAEVIADRLTSRAGLASGVAAEVLQATAALARDRGLLTAVQQRIRAGSSAPHATVSAAEQFAVLFRQLGGLMAERVTDLHDVRDRLLAQLAGVAEPGIPQPDVPSVLVADDLAPADTAGLDPARVVALATRLGGPTSHTAIIARQLGIPCVVAVADLDELASGTPVLVDGSTGEVVSDPDPMQAAARMQAAIREEAAVAGWRGPGRTADGLRVEVLANVQDGAGARAAAGTPAEGIGLFRTELCFLDRDREPTVEEQADIYAEVLAAFAGRKVVLRTLDTGSDKPLAFASMPDEANPALGVRGLRIALDDPGILDRQLDAVALAAERTGNRPWVMAPMVATVGEARFFATRARERGLHPGVMVEVPAAALHADRLLAHVEFLSLGTNDLAQYTMAADRLSAELASLTDPWQPALLALVARTASAGRSAGKPVGVCGEAAADPLLGCVLVGLGVTSLSAAAAA